ncbi:hypothetical protein ABT160_24605 [Streptomyces sp. NPDC001941]|uniref:hypothetical protein n=1 Tax=Streptomyces sp. NPDC001941 TaxID=3154659 RepID=UPI00332FE591
MPKQGRAPWKTKPITCPACGTRTKASLATGRLYEHPAPAGPGTCPKSRTVVLGGEEIQDSYECACGTWARTTLKNKLAEHHMPEGERCPLSGEPISAPTPRPAGQGVVRMVAAPPAHGWRRERLDSSDSSNPERADSSGSSSVYAILAGLPGHGRRY